MATAELCSWAGLGWGELELSLSTKQTGIQGPRGNKARRNKQLVAGVEEGVLCFGPLSTDKICTENFFKRIWEENSYYIHKQYSVFFNVSNLSKVDLWAKLEEFIRNS